ncbi:MAG TPA: hypothetical protein VGR70_08490 [Stellaceae bacterium]|nr:hypothetical protein [Stellaceae bacterium]
MDFGLLSLCQVDAGWYERYWYGDNPPSRLGILLKAMKRLCRQLSSPGWAWLAIQGGAFSSLNHGRATCRELADIADAPLLSRCFGR